MLLSTLIGIFLFIPLMVSKHWHNEFWAGQKKSGLCSYTFQLFALIYVNFLWLGPKLKVWTTGLYAQYTTVIISLKTPIFIDCIFLIQIVPLAFNEETALDIGFWLF